MGLNVYISNISLLHLSPSSRSFSTVYGTLSLVSLLAKWFIKPKFTKQIVFYESSCVKASEINAIANISRASLVPDTMTQCKADYQSLL